jgi:predicted DNA-binding transcriptional regulator AlpA
MFRVLHQDPEVDPPGARPERFDQLIDIRDVARILAIGKRTLERMIATGEFPRADYRVRRISRWRLSTVQAWMDRAAPRRDCGSPVVDRPHRPRAVRGKRGVA